MSDEYQSIPVAVARAAVQESGELEGVEGPLFLAEVDDDWQPFFSKVRFGEGAHPEFAKITVTRNGQKPREVVISWDEYADRMDADPEWDAIRASKPMSVFGGECERHAYRVVFADVLAKLDRPRESPDALSEDQLQSLRDKLSAPARGWHADLAAASTKAEIDALFEEARAARVLKDASLHEAFTRRLREVLASPKPVEPVAWEPKPTPAPTLGTVPSPAVVAAKVKPLTVQPVKRHGDRPQGQRRRGKR